MLNILIVRLQRLPDSLLCLLEYHRMQQDKKKHLSVQLGHQICHDLKVTTGLYISDRFFVLFSGVFLTFGCSGVVPAIHFIAAYGIELAHQQASVGWMALMGVLYITGAVIYATRVPERFFPGKFNLWVSVCFKGPTNKGVVSAYKSGLPVASLFITWSCTMISVCCV